MIHKWFDGLNMNNNDRNCIIIVEKDIELATVIAQDDNYSQS